VRTTLWKPWLAVAFLALSGPAMAQNLPFGISLPPSLNFATSPSPVGSGARAVGKATAFIGVADDATAASHNPGGLVQLERPEVSVVGSYFVRIEQQDVTQPATGVEGQHLDSFDLNYLSAVYPFEVLRRTVIVSLNVQRLFDLQGATDVTSRFATIDGVQRVSSRQAGGLFTISPAVAVQVTPAFSVGVAFNVWPDLFGNGWEQEVTVQGDGFIGSGNRIVPFTSQGRIAEDFAFEGFNVTAGFLWTISPRFSLGGVFRSPFTARVPHAHTSTLTVTLQDGSAPVTSALSFRDTLDLDMPMAYGLGLAARLSDRFTISFDVARIHWSDFRLEESSRDDVLLVENGAPSGKGRAVLSGAADDTTSVRLGAEYLWIRPQLLTPWFGARRVVVPVRAGFFYDPEPGDGPPDNFFGFSLGTGIAVGSFVFDLAYTFRTGTVKSAATDTQVFQHHVLTSIIYHF
jgi:long-subunit fatty acid transport protein